MLSSLYCSSIIGSLEFIHPLCYSFSCKLPPSGIIIAIVGDGITALCFGYFFTKKYGRHEMVLTHLSLEAFVCILPEHLGIPPRERI